MDMTEVPILHARSGFEERIKPINGFTGDKGNFAHAVFSLAVSTRLSILLPVCIGSYHERSALSHLIVFSVAQALLGDGAFAVSGRRVSGHGTGTAAIASNA